MSCEHGIAVRRLLAFVTDWFVAVLWGGALFGVVTIATAGNLPRPTSAWLAQGIGFLTMTIPITLYFAICESSTMRASLGKRALGLVVSRQTGERLTFGGAAARNAVKFVPWELGHTVANQAVFSEQGGIDTWVWAPAALAFACPIWWLFALVVTARAPYDRWTMTRVELATHDCQDAITRAPAARQGSTADDRPQAGDRG